MMKGLYFESKSLNPYENLAIEEYLLHLAEDNGFLVFYLWQNENTIVIGRYQNAYTECNLDFVEQNDVNVARRLTGGGAVYHDKGNLNFTMIFPKTLYDIERSTNVIVTGLNRIGILALANGRNDICLNDKKISGNAYYSNEFVGLHHGTILYRVDKEKVKNALSVPKYKLAKRGISSVKARIGDIVTRYPESSLEEIKNSLKVSFLDEYEIEKFEGVILSENSYSAFIKKYSSHKWIFGKVCEYEESLTQEFIGGIVTISMHFEGERVQKVDIATDSLEIDAINKIKHQLNEKIKKCSLDDIQQLMQLFIEGYKNHVSMTD